MGESSRNDERFPMICARDSSRFSGVFCDLQTRVSQALRQSSYASLRHVRVTFKESTVCLTGSVPTYFLKQQAQAVCLNIEGVFSIDNRLMVRTHR